MLRAARIRQRAVEIPKQGPIMPASPSKRQRSRPAGKQARATLRPANSVHHPTNMVSAEVVDVTRRGMSAISPEREYAFIRADLRRLLLTAAILIAVMVALLLLIDQ
jgi:hypothetical protein